MLFRSAVALLLIVAFAGVATARFLRSCRAPDGPRDPVAFTVEVGESGADVIAALHAAGVVPCGSLAGWDLRRSGLAPSIRAGSYELTTNMAFDDVLAVITAPPPEAPTTRVTIPEGLRITQIARSVHEQLGIPAKRFLAAIEGTDWSLPPYLPRSAASPEGFLFPDTYEFLAEGTTAHDVIQRLLDQFSTEAATLPWADADALGVTPYEIVVIASMVEEEAKLDGDRALIAAVIYNRLKVGMTLGFDTTVAYIDPDPSNGLTASDFLIDSPYNTRLNPGLPPTPISNPGVASLLAALQPASVDYLYFVGCPGDGGAMTFSSSYAQFLRDKACLG